MKTLEETKTIFDVVRGASDTVNVNTFGETCFAFRAITGKYFDDVISFIYEPKRGLVISGSSCVPSAYGLDYLSAYSRAHEFLKGYQDTK